MKKARLVKRGSAEHTFNLNQNTERPAPQPKSAPQLPAPQPERVVQTSARLEAKRLLNLT